MTILYYNQNPRTGIFTQPLFLERGPQAGEASAIKKRDAHGMKWRRIEHLPSYLHCYPHKYMNRYLKAPDIDRVRECRPYN